MGVSRDRGAQKTGLSKDRDKVSRDGGSARTGGAEATCGALMRVQAGQVQLLNKVAWSTAAAAASGGTHPPPPCKGIPFQIYLAIFVLVAITLQRPVVFSASWMYCTSENA